MSAFDRHFERVGRPALARHLGRPAVYVPATGPQVTLASAIVGAIYGTTQRDRARTHLLERTVVVSRADVLSPRLSDTVLIDDGEGEQTWSVTAIEGQTETSTTVTVQRTPVAERAHDNFRSR